MRILCIIVLCLLAGCASTAPVKNEPVECSPMFVILPGNFIIDLAAGSEVFLNPAVQDFELFCSLQSAQTSLNSTFGAQNPQDWRIYIVEGHSGDIAKNIGNNRFMLIKPVRVLDWEQSAQ